MRSLLGPLSRRTVHAVVAGAVVAPLAGCDLPGGSPDEPASGPAAPTADERLVDQVTAAIVAAHAVAVGTPAGRPLAAAHEAHLAALGATATPSASPSAAPSPASPPASAPARPTGDLRRVEAELETTLTEAARRAEDGGLARLLASMAASVAQHLAVLTHPEQPR